MDDIWGFAKDAAKVTLGAAKVTTNLITDSTLSTANLLKESVFLTKDIVGATASFTYNTATTGIYKTTDLLGLNNAAYELVKQYLINYLLNNPDEEKYKPLYKNLCYFTSGIVLFPIERVRILLMNHHIMIPSSFPLKLNKKETINGEIATESNRLQNLNNEKSLKRNYNGAFNCFFKELRHGGFFSLYKGCISLGVYKLIYFNLLDYRIKSLFSQLLLMKNDKKKAEIKTNINIVKSLCKFFDDKTLKLLLFAKELFLTDLLLFHASHPFQRYFVQTNTFQSQTGVKIFLKQNIYPSFKNITNLYSGWSLGIISLCSKYLLLIPILKYLHLNITDDLSLLTYLIPSIIFVEFITYPLEVLKFRFMVNNSTEITSTKYSNVKNAVKRILNEEYFNGFYKGAWLKGVNVLIIKLFYLCLIDYYTTYIGVNEPTNFNEKVEISEQEAVKSHILKEKYSKIKNRLDWKDQKTKDDGK